MAASHPGCLAGGPGVAVGRLVTAGEACPGEVSWETAKKWGNRPGAGMIGSQGELTRRLEMDEIA